MIYRINSFHYAMLLAYMAAASQINYNSGLVWPEHEYHDDLIIFDNYKDFSSANAYVVRNADDIAMIEDMLLYEHKQSYHPNNTRAFNIITKYSTPVYEIKHEVTRMVWPGHRYW